MGGRIIFFLAGGVSFLLIVERGEMFWRAAGFGERIFYLDSFWKGWFLLFVFSGNYFSVFLGGVSTFGGGGGRFLE